MRLTKTLIRTLLIACVVLGGRSALAGPARCSVNNQDSTCVGQVVTAWQVAPTCSTAAGWTTVVPASWIGSQYSAPQCNYQAPPTCPSGYDQTPPASWDGSNWVGLGCTPRSPPPPPNDPASACAAAVPGGYTSSGSWQQVNGGYIWDSMAQGAGISGYSSEWQLYPVTGPAYSNACGTGNQYLTMCYVRPDGSVAGLMEGQTQQTSSGQCNH